MIAVRSRRRPIIRSPERLWISRKRRRSPSAQPYTGRLVRQRKVALRLGRLGHGDWKILPGPTKELLEKRKTIDELAADDVQYDVAQKGVDMRIGLDIASLSQKQFVRRIVLVAGDADFVPAAKFARREGIDVILDPMWRDISDDLLEHIDGLRSVCPKPKPSGGSK